MKSDINEIICIEISSLMEKVTRFSEGSVSESLALGSLATAHHLLSTNTDTVHFNPEESKQPRDLRQQWAGNLPFEPSQAVKTKSHPERIPANGLLGGEPDEYEVHTHGDPAGQCTICNARLDAHPVDNNARMINKSLPFIICGGDRVYC